MMVQWKCLYDFGLLDLSRLQVLTIVNKIDAEENSNWPKRKKRKERKEHIAKKLKVAGNEQINHGGKHVDPRTTGPDYRRGKLRLLSEFNDLESKNEQDSYFSGLISVRHIARRRPWKPDDQKRKDHSAAFVYKVRINCRQAFISSHSITRGRVYNIQQSLLPSGESPKDQRGKHDNRHMKYPSAIHDITVQHIQSLHARSSHYSLRYDPDRKYLPESLTISKKHEMLLNKYHVNVPYRVYWNTCYICDTLAIKINNPECSTEERNKKKKFRKQARAGDIVCLSFDCMQDLPLPHLKTNAVFYSRSDSVTMFTYHEGDGRKGSNEVTSMLLTYINNNNEPFDNFVLISDCYCGQNKNQTRVHFIFTLVHCFHVFKSVTYLFLVRGHSYLSDDHDFSLIAKRNNILNLSNYQKSETVSFKKQGRNCLHLVSHISWTMADMLSSEETYASCIIFTITVCNTSPNCTSEEEISSTADAICNTRNRRFYEDLTCGVTKEVTRESPNDAMEVSSDDNSSGSDV
ncbi:hypothetical protein PR048_020457 [Dryococelus australis]|uniref:DUF7869 domain-containing protein n=1 Tax=Dryococelus australis TaxID=614101 RepID=A0ABQ9H6C0_9NEOP|nr:hypothetical protein PR048_020457 [Dryococelus australis]